jgi:hypothetical protein
MVVRYIKNLINELVKLKKDAIVNDYLKGVETHRVKDKYIKRWIRNVLLSMSDNKAASSNKVNTSYSNINTMATNSIRQPSSSKNIDTFKNKTQPTHVRIYKIFIYEITEKSISSGKSRSEKY